MNYADLGTYVSGDTGTNTQIELVDRNGAAFDLTGATAITLEAASTDRDMISLAGTISGAAALGIIAFAGLAAAFVPTAARPAVRFAGIVKWAQAGLSFRSRDGVHFTIARLP